MSTYEIMLSVHGSEENARISQILDSNLSCKDCKYFDIKRICHETGEDICLCQCGDNSQEIYGINNPMQITEDFLCKYFEINKESFYHNHIEDDSELF